MKYWSSAGINSLAVGSKVKPTIGLTIYATVLAKGKKKSCEGRLRCS